MSQTAILWFTILAAGVLTFLTRLSFIALHERIRLPEWVTRALTFVPIAVLSAIILPELVIQDNALYLALGNFRLWAGLAAAVVAWRTKNVWLTIAVGMLVLWGLTYLLG